MDQRSEMKLWMRQWRLAEKGLAEQKQKDLQVLTEENARLQSSDLLSLAEQAFRDPARLQNSGLVEQQRWFRLWRS